MILGDISAHILDLCVNSVRAGASEISVKLELIDRRFFFIKVEDNGCGINDERFKTLFQSNELCGRFGHGLKLFKNLCEKSGGCFGIVSGVNSFRTVNVECERCGMAGAGSGCKAGTAVSGCIDIESGEGMLPIGDLGGVIRILVCAGEIPAVMLDAKNDKKRYSRRFCLSTKNALAPESAGKINEAVTNIFGGVL